MAYTFPAKLQALRPYTPVALDTSLIHLDANESCCGLPEVLMQQVAAAIQKLAFNRYPDAGAQALCQAFAAFYQVDPGHVTAGNGSDELISLLYSAFLQKGEVAVTTDPDFSMYAFYPKVTENPCVQVEKADYALHAQALVRAVRERRARLLLFSNPCNPTSVGIAKEEVLSIVRALPDTLVVVDEAYMDFWEPAQSLLGEEADFANLLILRTCSKMGLAALRVGFAVANESLSAMLRAVKSPYNVNAATQCAAALALREGKALRANIAAMQASRDALASGLAALLRAHPGAFALYDSRTNFVSLRTPQAAAMHSWLMQRGVSVRLFPGLLRVTGGTPAENTVFLEAMGDYLAQK